MASELVSPRHISNLRTEQTRMHNRRSILRDCVGFFAFALVAELSTAGAQASGLSGRRWVSLHRDLARGLRNGSVGQVQWHEAVNSLARELDLEQLAAELRRARLKEAGVPFGHDPQKRFVTMLDEQGLPLTLEYGLALFDFNATSVITPHAHKHMASAHMVIDGRVRVRTFDRVREESGALVIRAKADVVAEPGHSAAMTSARDNVHWFVPRTARAMTLDIIVDGLDAGQERYLIQPIDPLGGRLLADGTTSAPIISFERSMQIYTAGR
jgi:hypothetical protein